MKKVKRFLSFYLYETFICYRECLDLNCYIGKKMTFSEIFEKVCAEALKRPSLARSVLKPLKAPSLARSVPKPL